MKVIGSTTAGAAVVSPKLGGSFVGLATGMFISPCVVFPAGAEIIDLRISAGENFQTSVNAAEESYLYSFTVTELSTISLRFSSLSSVTAKVSDASDATTRSLSFSSVNTAAAKIDGLGGAQNELAFTATNELSGLAILGGFKASFVGFSSSNPVSAAAVLKVTKVGTFAFSAMNGLSGTANLKITRPVEFSYSVVNSVVSPAVKLSIIKTEVLGFIKTHSLNTAAVLKLPPVIALNLDYSGNVYGDPLIVWDTRNSWWAFEDDSGITPYRSPIYKTRLYRSSLHPRAVLTIT